MNKIFKYTPGFAALLLFFFSCAKSDEGYGDITLGESLDAWVQKYRPDMKDYRVADGLYIKIIDGGGTETYTPVDSNYVDITFTSRQLNGTCFMTTDPERARDEGTYSPRAHYVPLRVCLGLYFESYYGISTAQYAALVQMKQGDSVEIISGPRFAYGGLNVDSVYLGFEGSGAYTHGEIFSVSMKLHEIFTQLETTMSYRLEEYAEKEMGIAEKDSIHYGIYLKKHPDKTFPNNDTIPGDSIVRINYIGRFLDGFVFDTNIESVAKEHRIYDATRTYGPYNIGFTYADTTMLGNRSVDAFKYALRKMRVGEAATVATISKWAYGVNGLYRLDNTIIPSDAPLVYDIEIIPPTEW